MCMGEGGGCEDVSWIRSDVWYILCVDNYFTGTGQTSVLQECSQGPATSLDPGGGVLWYPGATLDFCQGGSSTASIAYDLKI